MLVFKVFGVFAGTVAIVAPASIGGVVAYRKSSSSGSQHIISSLKDRCYEIPTAGNHSAKLLACSYSSHTKYFLYNWQGNKNIGSPEQIKRKGDNLEIFWESWGESSGRGGPKTQVNLKVNFGNWSRISEEVDLQRSCQLVTGVEGAEGAEWKCSGNSLVSGTGGETIKLTKFTG